MKRVIIVGGGYAGVALARVLDANADVQLIEPRDSFIHNVGAIRAVVDPALLDRIIIPYSRLLKNGSVRQAAVATVSDHGVTLSDGTALEADIVVVATGSRYAAPFKGQDHATASFRADSLGAHAALKEARHIAIVGGGVVGVELAGEIAAAHPGRKVTLISLAPSLMTGYPPRLAEKLEKQLRDMGVTLRLGVQVKDLKTTQAPFAGPLTLDDGVIDADLVFPTIGTKPVSDLVGALPGATTNGLGQVEVDDWLRPSTASRLFALGDMAATGDKMTIVAITRQAPWLSKTIKALVAGSALETLPKYTPWSKPALLVPLGPRQGASVLPLTNEGVVFGRRTTSMIKGKELFIPKYWKEFGFPAKQR